MKLHLDNVSKRYGQSWALRGLTMGSEAAGCLALIGPSGGGKSTALRIIAGLERATEGSVVVNGFNLSASEPQLREYRRSIGVVFQAYNLFPHFDALTNVALPLEKVYGQSKDKARSRALELLERLQLQDHRFKKPAALSGGQSQRVALARALAHEPQLLLLDEPTSALDPEMTAEVLDVIVALIQEGRQVVIATHEMGFARLAAERVVLIADGQAVEDAPAAELFAHPRTETAQRFLSRVLKY